MYRKRLFRLPWALLRAGRAAAALGRGAGVAGAVDGSERALRGCVDIDLVPSFKTARQGKSRSRSGWGRQGANILSTRRFRPVGSIESITSIDFIGFQEHTQDFS